jgi:hypothetical protein
MDTDITRLTAGQRLAQVRRLPHPVPVWVYLLAWMALMPLLIGPNPGLTVVAGLVGTALPALSWRAGESPTLFWISFWQWAQAFVGILRATLAGVTVADFFGGKEYEESTLLTLCGVLCFAAAAGWAYRRVHFVASNPNAWFGRLRVNRLVAVWLVLSVGGGVISTVTVGTKIGSALQPFAYLYMGAMLLIFQYCLVTGRRRSLALMVIAVEVGMGFTGYFGGFRIVGIIAGLALFTFVAERRRLWGAGIVVGLAFALMASFWQIIKTDYRTFMSGGEESQVVSVSIEQRLDYLGRAIQGVSLQGLLSGIDDVLDRLGYVTYFGNCLRTVPSSVPHAEGRLWKEAIAHVLMPRILFPNKQVFNDSDRTNEFSDVRVADASQGTSIGIGYIGESYVDFGVPLMFLPILLFGGLVGWCYGKIVQLAPVHILGIALATTMILRSTVDVASSNAKMMGAIVSTFLIYYVLLKVAGDRVWAWISLPAPKTVAIESPAPSVTSPTASGV